MKGGDDMKSV